MNRHRWYAAVALAMFIGVTFASAADASGAVDRQAWAQTGPVLTFVPADGELYVAATAGNEEARSFVDLDLRGMEEQEIRSSSLILEEAESSFLAEAGQLVACALEDPIEGEGKISGAPPLADCSLRTSANRDDDGTWTVELAVFAPRWAAGENHGLVLFPDLSATAATFRVAFGVTSTTVVVPEPGQASTPPSTLAPASPTTGPAITPDLRGPSFTELTLPPLEVAAPAVPPTGGPGDGSPDGPATVPPGGRIGGRSTTGSSLAWMALLGAAVVVIVAATPLRRRVVLPSPTERAAMARPMALVGLAGLSLLPLLAREVIVYKAGVVMIFFVAAIGLHVLVNWAGELSLAHAGMVGLPAFSVLALSSVHGISAVYLLPVGVLIGGAVGAIVALPTLRARGVQVALVTLIAGIAIDRYFFTKSWLVGPVSGRAASSPRLGPIEFTTSRSLYVVLVVIVAGAVLAAWMLMHSKVARAWYWIRVNSDAAAAFGVPVVLYRILAYTTGGAFAGLAGGLTVMWTQRLGPGAFPTSSSFTYLLVAVLAGAGFVGGLVATTLMLPGGQQFATNIFGVETGRTVDAILAYGGPLGLINVLIFHKSGLNGLGRNLMARIAPSGDERITPAPGPAPQRGDPVSLSLIGGFLFIGAGFLAIALAWTHSSETDQLWVQNQEILSGGIGGLALVLVGVGLLIRDRIGRNHVLLAQQLDALLGRNEESAAATDSAISLMPPTAAVDGVHAPTERARTRRPLSRADG
jgi:branched-chain amino acid transport system permease protein